jgi:N-acetylglucosamine-6-sulfatase
MWNNRNATFLELIKKAGYDTAFIGKWHMPGNRLHQIRSVDEFITFTKEDGQGVYYDCPLVINDVETPRPGKYITNDLTDLALHFIEKKRMNPFCLYLSHKAVHFGFRPTEHLKKLYEGQNLHLPHESDTWVTLTNNNIFVGAPMPMNILYRNYLRVVASVYEQVGRLPGSLEQTGQLDNTVIVYAGDNGHLFGEHGLYDKRNAYEESIRIPFLIRYPKLVRQTGIRNQMVLEIDLAPTLLDIIGAEIPAFMQGRSMVPCLKNPSLEGWTPSFMNIFLSSRSRFPASLPSGQGTSNMSPIKKEPGATSSSISETIRGSFKTSPARKPEKRRCPPPFVTNRFD